MRTNHDRTNRSAPRSRSSRACTRSLPFARALPLRLPPHIRGSSLALAVWIAPSVPSRGNRPAAPPPAAGSPLWTPPSLAPPSTGIPGGGNQLSSAGMRSQLLARGSPASGGGPAPRHGPRLARGAGRSALPRGWLGGSLPLAVWIAPHPPPGESGAAVTAPAVFTAQACAGPLPRPVLANPRGKVALSRFPKGKPGRGWFPPRRDNAARRPNAPSRIVQRLPPQEGCRPLAHPLRRMVSPARLAYVATTSGPRRKPLRYTEGQEAGRRRYAGKWLRFCNYARSG